MDVEVGALILVNKANGLVDWTSDCDGGCTGDCNCESIECQSRIYYPEAEVEEGLGDEWYQRVISVR